MVGGRARESERHALLPVHERHLQPACREEARRRVLEVVAARLLHRSRILRHRDLHRGVHGSVPGGIDRIGERAAKWPSAMRRGGASRWRVASRGAALLRGGECCSPPSARPNSSPPALPPWRAGVRAPHLKVRQQRRRLDMRAEREVRLRRRRRARARAPVGTNGRTPHTPQRLPPSPPATSTTRPRPPRSPRPSSTCSLCHSE